MRAFLIGFSILVGLVLVAALLAPEGELVVLHTVDAAGEGFESTLWVVELAGSAPGELHLRSGNPESRWLARLTTHPLVELERGSDAKHYRAVPLDDAEVRRAVNAAMAAKYGLADRFVKSQVDVERSIPVRLEPIEGAGAAAFH